MTRIFNNNNYLTINDAKLVGSKVEVKSKVSGLLGNVTVAEGTNVKAGDIIAEIEKNSVEVMKISYPNFQQIMKYNLEVEFLSKICPQGKDAIRAFIDDLYHRDVSFNPLDCS